MTRDEILDAVRSIYFGPTQTEVVTPLREKLRYALPHSEINDLIFSNPIELTSKQVVDEATQRQAQYTAKHSIKPAQA